MISILALILMLIILIKVVSFMIFPEETVDFSEQSYTKLEQYGMILQGVLIVLATIVGFGLAMMIGFYTMIAAGWFWVLFYSIFLVPFTLESIKTQHLKSTLFSPNVKHQLMASCIFAVCLCILTIALLI